MANPAVPFQCCPHRKTPSAMNMEVIGPLPPHWRARWVRSSQRIWVLGFVPENIGEGPNCDHSLKWISQSSSSPSLVSGSTFHVFTPAGLLAIMGCTISLTYLLQEAEVTVNRQMSVALLASEPFQGTSPTLR